MRRDVRRDVTACSAAVNIDISSIVDATLSHYASIFEWV